MALLNPQYMNAVVALGIPKKSSEQWVASGFIYGHRITHHRAKNQKYRMYLVSNRHVFEGQTKMIARFNPRGRAYARKFHINLEDQNGTPIWVPHPKPEIDVGVIPIDINVLRNEKIQFSYFLSTDHAADIKKLRSLGIQEGDPTFILGFPMGLVGNKRNAVMVRGGPIARIQDTYIKLSDNIIVDTLIFPGNSGGPVVTRPEVTAIKGTQGQGASYLIGIVSGYLPYTDVAVSQQTGNPRITFEENSGLATAHPIDCVNETIRIDFKNEGIKIGQANRQ